MVYLRTDRFDINYEKAMNALEDFTKMGKLNGKNVVLINSSNEDRNGILAGVGPNMFDGLAAVFVVVGCLFTTAAATLAVALSTKLAPKPTLITLGVGLGITAAMFAAVK